MQKIKTKDGFVDEDGYLLDENDERTEIHKPKEDFFSIKGKNIIHTYFWAYDLRGRLRRELKPPSEYHGLPRTYVREDVEHDDWNNTLTSYLRVYIGKSMKALIHMKPRPKRVETFLEMEQGDDFDVKKKVTFLLNEETNEDGVSHFGWEFYQEGGLTLRRRRKTPIKTKRSIKPKNKPKKVIRRVVKKVVRKKRK